MEWVVGIILAFIVLKVISYLRRSGDVYGSTKSLKPHDIHGGYLLGKIQKAAYNAQADAVDAKTRAKHALINLQGASYDIEIAAIESEKALKKSEYDQKMQPLQLEWEWETLRLQHELSSVVTEGAKEKKVDLPTYNAIMLLEGQAKVDVEKEKGLSGIRVDEHEKMKRIDVDAALMEQLNTISALLQYKNIRYNELDEMRNRIFALIDEEDRIDNSNATALVKGQKLSLIEGDKRFYKEVLDALKSRLLEAGDGEEISGIEAFTSNFGGLGADSESGSQNQLPITVTRSGGEQGNH